MSKIKDSLATAISSQKFWFTLLGMAGAGITAYLNQGNATAVILAMITFLGLPTTFVAAKTYQNTHGVNSPEVIAETIKQESIPVPVEAPKILTIRERIVSARKMYSIWDNAKMLLLGTFKDRFESALKRLVLLNPNIKNVEAARQAIEEITGVCLDEKTCAAISGQPGMLGAVGANADIKIISDLLDAIDRMPELAYKKAEFTEVAIRYAIQNIIFDAIVRIQNGIRANTSEGFTVAKNVLKEFGLTDWQINKSEFSGAQVKIWYSTTGQKDSYQLVDFDAYELANVDQVTLKDLR